MQTNFEQVVEAANHLSAEEIQKLGEWVREKEREIIQKNGKNEKIEEKAGKFNLAMKWIEKNQNEFLGKWVCLDGDKLISYGEDGTKVYDEAIAKGIESPFMEFVKEDETHYMGGWEKCR